MFWGLSTRLLVICCAADAQWKKLLKVSRQNLFVDVIDTQ
jgi:hypothetical protein